LAALLSEWGSESLAKCAEVEGLRSRSLLDEELAVHSAGYLEKRMAQEFARSRRFALPLSLLLARVAPGPKVPEERHRALLSAAARVLRETTRDIDIVARSPFPEADLAVLLPTATRERAEEILAKTREALAGLDLPAEVRFGLGAYAAAMTAPEDLILDAQRPLR
jgi:PleD family two-component response regulator